MSDPDPAGNIIGTILIAVVFLLLTAIFHIADEAFSAVGEIRIRELEEEGSKKARRIRLLTEKGRQFSSRIRLSTLCFGIFIAAAVFYCFIGPVTLWLKNTIRILPVHAAVVIAYFLLTLAILFVITSFGCILPRRLVYLNIENVALKVVGIFSFFYALFRPLYALCAWVVSPFLRMAGIDPHEDPNTVTEEDIMQLMNAGEEIGAIEGTQKNMVSNIFEFDDITAEEIMTPRTDVIAVEAEDTLENVLQQAVDNGYSRIPVYEEDIDHIIGILYIKDLLPYVGQNMPTNICIRTLLRETHFVPDTKKCDDLFEEMTEKHLQMSIVVDEYGGVAGIVTMEDLLESIVGNMQDEFDNEKDEIVQLDDNSFEVDGSLNISDLNEVLDTELPEGDYDTVAGFVIDQLGHIPSENEQACIEYKNITFTILQMDDRRIEQVLIRRNLPEENAGTKDSE